MRYKPDYCRQIPEPSSSVSVLPPALQQSLLSKTRSKIGHSYTHAHVHCICTTVLSSAAFWDIPASIKTYKIFHSFRSPLGSTVYLKLCH